MKALYKSFVYAFRGIFYCLRNERNVRIHLVVALYLLVFSLFYDFTRLEYALLFIAITLVIAAEMINTAIETIVNLLSPSYDQLARIAKDAAAGAVLACAVFSVGVGVALFGHLAVFRQILDFFLLRPALIFVLAFSLVLSYFYIFLGPKGFWNLLFRRRR